MSGVREGMDVDRIRSIADEVAALGRRAEGMHEAGTAMLRTLDGVWEGDDLAGFHQGWQEAGPQIAAVAEALRGAGEDLRRQAGDQEGASRGKGGGERGWELPDFDFPDLNPFDDFGWELPDVEWPTMDIGAFFDDLWDGILDALEGIGDWWDDIPWWGQLIIGIVAAVVIIAVAVFFGAPVAAAIAVVAAVVGAVMTILDILDAVAEFFRNPGQFIDRLLDDPLAALGDLAWLLVGFLPYGIGKFLQRFRKPMREFSERISPAIGRKLDEVGEWLRKKWDDLTRTVNDWDKQLRRKYGWGAKELADPPPNTYPSQAKVQKKYNAHAEDFGVDGNWNKANGEKFKDAVDDHIADPATRHIDGYYRGDPAILDYNPASGLVTVRSPDGAFISGWKASPAQIENIEKRGSLQ